MTVLTIILIEVAVGESLTADPASDGVLMAEPMVKYGELDLSADEMQEVILNDEGRPPSMDAFSRAPVTLSDIVGDRTGLSGPFRD